MRQPGLPSFVARTDHAHMLAAAARPSRFQLRGVDGRPSAGARRPAVVAAGRGASDAPERPQKPAAPGAAVPLAGGGALWWQVRLPELSWRLGPVLLVCRLAPVPHSCEAHKLAPPSHMQSLHSGGTRPVYGPLTHDTFVMQRPEIGGPGLVRVPRQPKPVRAPMPPPASPPVVWVGPPAAGALTLAGSSVGSCSVVIDTDYVVLPPQQQQAAVQPNTTCVGIVWQGSVEGEADAEASAAAARGRKRSRHPRRTQTVRLHGREAACKRGIPALARPKCSALAAAGRTSHSDCHLPLRLLFSPQKQQSCCLQLRFTGFQF